MHQSEGDILLEGEDLIIGGWIPGDGDYEGSHSGGLDDVAVFSDALSESDIMNYMNNSLVGNEKSLVGFWSFNSGEGDFLYDH